ncbi:tetratricopeptide repeat protein [Tsuneonella amylolytica]|uniref:tetratricopeptide repeat protein n=1 Tax=Tsuneonella amylolytica TaxID=2338327 RepID=UPI000EA98584|nr:tetratricopeptide repeat protein [Tsuneonella amylolytica]
MALPPSTVANPDDKRARANAAQEDVLLREVDDAVRQDQYAEAAQKYGKPLTAAVLLGLAAFGGYLYWENHQKGVREADSEALVSAMDQVERGNLASGDTALAPVISDGNPGAKAAAELLKAGIALEQNKPAEAATIFERVAADDAAPQAYRDLATIRAVTARYDTMKPADVIARLKPLATPGNPWFGPAGEIVGMAYLDQGNQAEAGALFAAIAKDANTSDTLKSRMRQMAGLLGVDAIDDVDTVIRQTGTATPPSTESQ